MSYPNDNFTGAALTDIAGRALDDQGGGTDTWFKGIGSNRILLTGSGTAYAETIASVSAYWTTANATDINHGATVTLDLVTTSGMFGAMVGLKSTTGAAGDTYFYLGRFNQSSGNFEIVRYTTGSYAVLDSVAGTVADGDTLRIERVVAGSDVHLFLMKNGSNVLTEVDLAPGTNFTTGVQFGIWAIGGDDNEGYHFDRFATGIATNTAGSSGTLAATLGAVTIAGTGTAGSLGGSVGTLAATLGAVTLAGVATSTGGTAPVEVISVVQGLPSGLSTVGYRVKDADGNIVVALTTTGVAEIEAGSGDYSVAALLQPGASYRFDWFVGAAYQASENIFVPEGAGDVTVSALDAYAKAYLYGNVLVGSDGSFTYVDADNGVTERLLFARRASPGGRIVTRDP